MKPLINEIKIYSKDLEIKSKEELNEITLKLKNRVKKEKLETILPNWFALVQEVSFRELGLRHFDVQFLAGLLLHEGKVVEMKTGEGKTLSSSLPASLNALSGKGVHVVTVNDYLAERDQKLMGKIYSALGLTSGLIKSSQSINEKRSNYNADITYLTNSELVFDYLRDSCAYNLKEIVQRPFSFCILDEIDSILIDEARTPLILSNSEGVTNPNKLSLAKKVAAELEKDFHFQIDEKRRDINLTEKGYNQSQKLLGKKSLYDPEDPWILELLNALKAQYIFKRNKDYIVLNNKIAIVDEFTGRVMEDRRWSMGIHEAIEIKEKVTLGGGTKTKTAITYQNFFPLYPKIAGMTGTAITAKQEFKDIYKLNVVEIPTNRPMIRTDLPDLVYQTELAKWKAVLEQSKKCFQKGQPVLIGTTTVEKSEFLSELFNVSKIPHQVLNAKPENLIRENEIIAQAGKPYTVTIATNMAGRGTDIILGGNPIFQVKEKIKDYFFVSEQDFERLLTFKGDPFFDDSLTPIGSEMVGGNSSVSLSSEMSLRMRTLYEQLHFEYLNDLDQLNRDILDLPYSLENAKKSLVEIYNWFFSSIRQKWEKENELVKTLGGLFVLGTERYETRRIDNQLRGRSGRQGDPGSSQFFVSLEDDLIKLFGGESIRKWINFLMEDKDLPLQSNFLTNSLENAQKKVESYNYEIRKNVFQYDNILNSQRKKFLRARNELLFENAYENLILRYAEICFDQEFFSSFTSKSPTTSLSGRMGIQFVEDLQNLTGKPSSFTTIWEKKKFLNKTSSSILFADPIRKTKLEKLFTVKYFASKKLNTLLQKNKNSGFDSFSDLRSVALGFQNDPFIFYKEIWITNDLRFAQLDGYQNGFLKKTRESFFLSIIDYYWTQHIERMTSIRETINWRAYGQQNPLNEYNNEGVRSFKSMFEQIRSSMIYCFLNSPTLTP